MSQFTHIVIQRLSYISSNEDKVLAYHDEAVRQEKIANAAPELLEALQALLLALATEHIPDDIEQWSATKRAQAAIQNATS